MGRPYAHENLEFTEPTKSSASEPSATTQQIASGSNSPERHLPATGNNSRFENILKDVLAEAKKGKKSTKSLNSLIHYSP